MVHIDWSGNFGVVFWRLMSGCCGKKDYGQEVYNGRGKRDKRKRRYNRDKVRKTDANAVICKVFLILSLFLYRYVLFQIRLMQPTAPRSFGPNLP